ARIAGRELLERQATDARAAALRHLVSGPAGHEDHLPLLGRHLRRQIGEAQHADAEGLDDALAVLVAEREVAEDLERGLVLLVPVEDRGRLIAGHGLHLRARDPQGARVLEVAEGPLVVLELDLAEALESEGEAVLRLGLDDAPEVVSRLLVLVEVVEERAERPTAFDPVRLDLEGLAVVADGFVELPSLLG